MFDIFNIRLHLFTDSLWGDKVTVELCTCLLANANAVRIITPKYIVSIVLYLNKYSLFILEDEMFCSNLYQIMLYNKYNNSSQICS